MQKVEQPSRITFFSGILHKVVHRGEKLLHILLLREKFWLCAWIEVLRYAAPLYYLCSQFVGIHRGKLSHEVVHHHLECPYLAYGTLIQFLGVLRSLYIAHHLPYTHILFVGYLYQFVYSGITNASGWVIHHSLKCLFVVRISHQSQVCHNVFYLLALIETQSAINSVWCTVFQHLVLECSALRIGAIEDSEIRKLQSVILHLSPYIFAHIHSLFPVTTQLWQNYIIAIGILTIDILLYLSFILVYQTVSRLYYSFCWTIVTLQFE